MSLPHAPSARPTGSDESARAATAGARLGYPFDPGPKWVKDLIRRRVLSPIDEPVLDILLRFRKRIRDSCWCCKSTIAAELGRSRRTVQRSLSRLATAGLIEQKPIEVPDPDEPRNGTGWRIVFLWLAPDGYVPGPGPDRAGLGVKKGPRPQPLLSPPPETLLSPPPPDIFVSPPRDTFVSQA